MTGTADRIDLHLSAQEAARICHAAGLGGIPPATFVLQAALREAEAVIARIARAPRKTVSFHLRGLATTGLGTEKIMKLTRDA